MYYYPFYSSSSSSSSSSSDSDSSSSVSSSSDSSSSDSSSSDSSSSSSSSPSSSSSESSSHAPFLPPGLSPYHLGNLDLFLSINSSYFSCQALSILSFISLSYPPSNRFFLSSYVLLSALLSNLEDTWILGGCFPVSASASKPFFKACALSF